MNYVKHLNASATPQSQPVFGKNQVKNSAGGSRLLRSSS